MKKSIDKEPVDILAFFMILMIGIVGGLIMLLVHNFFFFIPNGAYAPIFIEYTIAFEVATTVALIKHYTIRKNNN